MNDVKTLPIGSDSLLLHLTSISNPLLNSRYRVACLLGEGGFGRTFLCLDELLGTYTAVKEIKFSDGRARLESLKEVRTLAAFRGMPGIVSAIDFFTKNNKAYIVMDYIEGDNLKAYCKQNKPTWNSLMNILEEVFMSLCKMHEMGYVHRDISPGNIIVSNCKAKLLDFGSACRVGKCNQIIKPGYSPREQYRGEVGPWSDVYSMSATICSAYFGLHIPESIVREAKQLFTHKQIRHLSKDIGLKDEKYIFKVLQKALNDDYLARYRNMTEFYDALVESETYSTKFEEYRKILLCMLALITNLKAYECINLPMGISLFDVNSDIWREFVKEIFNV